MSTARLNIEGQFWVDVGSVAGKCGDYDRAVGQALRVLQFGQERHTKKKPIMYDEFIARFTLGDALMPEFARRVGDEVIIAGAAEYFGWLDKKAAAGAIGGRSKSEAKTKHLKQNRSTRPKQSKSASATEASSSISISSSISNSNSSIQGELPVLQPAPEPNPVAVYCEEWKAKNGRNLTVPGRDAGQLKRLADDLGAERACGLIRVYFSMPDAWFIKKGYDVSTLVSNLTAIQQFEANGKIVTAKVREHLETQVDKIQGTDRRQRKPIEDLERDRQAMLAEAAGQPMLGGSK